MAANLPLEIIAKILSRSFVDDLLRFRAVCKHWRSLIDGPDFVKLHLNSSPETRIVFGGLIDLYWTDPEALDAPLRIDVPIDNRSGVCVIGGCNGLLAVTNCSGVIAIWNPSTRAHVVLPPLVQALVIAYFEVTLLGFGFDAVSDDYKVLRVVAYRSMGKPNFHEVDVYSLKARAWKRIGAFPGHMRYDCPGNGVHVHNALHWIVKRVSDNRDTILAFDLKDEKPREFLIPENAGVADFVNCCVKLNNLGERLCLSTIGRYNREFQKLERVDVWVMNEYGVRGSWTKLFSVAAATPSAFFNIANPVYLKESGDQIIMNWDREKFVVYDLKAKKVKNVKGPCMKIVDTYICVRSLVSVRKDEGRSQKKGDKNKKRDDFLSKGFKLKL